MKVINQVHESIERETVLSFIEAMNAFDYKEARHYVSDALSFVGVMGYQDGADAYFQDMEKMKYTYDIQKVFVDGSEVCLWYEINMGGTKILCSGWYHVEHNRIQSFRVLFDPRPLLEKAGK